MIAAVLRELSFREKLQVAVFGNVNVVLVLAVVLAIEAIRNEPREQECRGGGLLGRLGGKFP
ncbi:MAG TPA: hypothetical protein VFQ44_11590 [Streptosporangiaceae bacterium]|nr:hypothetical protein [Streptosporangiaceae bacterium]